ncbi:MAG: glycosyltransferase [Thermoplasmataceae archaeon]
MYYWSKLTADEQFAGSDIRARYMIPELINLSNEPTFVLTPSMLIGEEFLSKHQSLSKLILAFIVPLYVFKYFWHANKSIRFIYCSTCYSWDLLPALVIKFFTGAKVVCVSHDTPMQLEGYTFYRMSEKLSIIRSIVFTVIGKLQIYLLKSVDLPISISNFAMDFFRTSNVHEKAILSSNGVSEVIEESNLGNDRIYDIVILGRIAPRKNIPLILKSLPDKSFFRKINLLVITNSSKKSIEETFSKCCDGDRINLTIKQSASELEKLELLKLSKIYISLSSDENFSVAALEAASMGTALILSRNTFFTDIYKDSAIFVDIADSNSTRREIETLLGDEAKLKEFQRLSLNLARNYIYSNIAEREYKMINALFERKKKYGV